ncbi:MAG: OmpA family protein [Thermodesulfobacteriota bacterium]|nr:OmpA family protein [Thermodesulfobacteriota bacterium]
MNIRFWTVCGLVLMMLFACAAPQTRTQKGAIYGAGGGAAAGAILGQIIGHDTKATLEGAAIGAAIGGLTGAGAGHYMDKQEQALQQAVASSEAAAVQRQGDILSVTLKSDFLFDVDSSVVHPGAYSEIDRLARVFTQYPDTKIRIEGHTDSTGPEEYNLRLSQRRAEAVKQLLVSKVVYPNRITAIGYGESRPKAGNDTPYGRQLNRRVEIYVEPR